MSAAVFDGRAIPPDARESQWRAPDGHLIRRIDWFLPEGRPCRGALLFAPGRADFYEKHLAVLQAWYEAGWNVTSLDWRGQGLSGRLGVDPTTGHMDDFAPWLDDLEAFWTQWCAGLPGPHVAIGHSMGGHLVLRAAAERRIHPAALVLVAPMLGLNPGWMPSMVLAQVGRVLATLRGRYRPAWNWEGALALSKARMRLLTHDAQRHADEDWWYQARPDLAVGPPSWGWIVAALASIRWLEGPGRLESLDVPTLVLGTSADRLVSWRAIRRAAARLPRARLVTFGAESRHEILRETPEVRARAMTEIAAFLDDALPPAPRA